VRKDGTEREQKLRRLHSDEVTCQSFTGIMGLITGGIYIILILKAVNTL
jgi:hypothetical protein